MNTKNAKQKTMNVKQYQIPNIISYLLMILIFLLCPQLVLKTKYIDTLRKLLLKNGFLTNQSARRVLSML